MKSNFATGGLSKKRGQGMMEYIIIVALIAVSAIGVYAMFGKTIRNQTAGLAKEVSGEKADITKATAAAGLAESRGDTTKGMNEYNKDNDQAGGGGGAAP